MKYMRVVIRTMVVCFGVVAIALSISGCAASAGSSSSSVSSAKVTSSASSSSQVLSAVSAPVTVIGEGSTEVQVTNATGYDVVGVRIKSASSESFTDKDSFSGVQFSNGQTVTLAFTQEAGAQAYDVVLLTASDAKIGVKNIDLVHAKDIVFHFDQGIGYITYTDTTTGATVDNRDTAERANNSGSELPADAESQEG